MARIFLILAFVLAAGPARAAPDAVAWERWRAHDPASRVLLDHAPWASFLSRYVGRGQDGIARVAYGAVTPGDKRALGDYVAALQSVAVSTLNRAEQKAYWINLYNALTVRVVLDHYPVASIRDIDISPGLFADGPWGARLLTIEGEAVSLDDIEHRILRPLWQDKRVHYALNCASLGCPDLQAEPFTAAAMDQHLNRAAKTFINHPRAAHVTDDGRLIVSSLYVWFQGDFGGSWHWPLRHLRRFANHEKRNAIARFKEPDGDAYDWALNDAR